MRLRNLAWLLFAVRLMGQDRFEVASIHLHQGALRQTGRFIEGPRITIDAMTAANLVMDAYEVRDFQIEGGPGWVKTDRYDIGALAPGEVAPAVADVRKMEQRLLADRFQLKFHRASREMPVYALTVAKSGSKLKENAEGTGIVMFRNSKPDSPTEVTGSGAAVDALVRSLSGIPGIDRPIIDRTGLTGKYDFKLNLLYKFLVDKSGPQAMGPDGESVFTAIEEQLGLKLEPQRLPVEILVIDSIERPSEN